MQALDAVVPGYMEIGDTAFVTVDNFLYSGNGIDYSALAPDQLQFDTIGSIIYAHKKIAREDSPIRNVVLDLSLNNGGAAPTAAYLIGWMLGDSRLSRSVDRPGKKTASATFSYRERLLPVFFARLRDMTGITDGNNLKGRIQI